MCEISDFDEDRTTAAISAAYGAIGMPPPHSVIFANSLSEGQALSILICGTDSSGARVMQRGSKLYGGARLNRLFQAIRWLDDVVDPKTGRLLTSYIARAPELLLDTVVEAAITVISRVGAAVPKVGTSSRVNVDQTPANIGNFDSECMKIENPWEYDAFLGILGNLDIGRASLWNFMRLRKVGTPNNPGVIGPEMIHCA